MAAAKPEILLSQCRQTADNISDGVLDFAAPVTVCAAVGSSSLYAEIKVFLVWRLSYWTFQSFPTAYNKDISTTESAIAQNLAVTGK